MGIQHRKCNILDRCWQQTLGPPERSTQHRGPGTGDLKGDAEREEGERAFKGGMRVF